MTVLVQNTALTNTYDFWRNRTNELADAMSTKTITVNSNTTTGNAVVNGTFQANNLHIVNTLRGGNNSTSATLVITSNLTVNGTVITIGNSTVNSTQVTTSTLSVGSNVVINSSSYFVGNSTVNTVITSTGLTVNSISVVFPVSINVQTTGTGSQVIDSFLKSSFRGAEYIFTLTDNSANGYQISKALVIHDAGDSYITEYGTVYSNTVLGVFSTSVNSTHSIVSVTPTISNMQVKGTKSLIVI